MILLLIVCNVSLLSAQEVQPTFASYTTTGSATSTKVPVIKKNYFRLGEKVLTLVRHGITTDEPYVVVALHSNEFTASEAAKKFVADNGGLYLELLNDNQKNIAFSLFNKNVVIDPNNIFTPKGRWLELSAGQKKDHIISQQITGFANFIIEELPTDKTIISVHNNVEGEFSITRYQKGKDLQRNVKLIYTNPESDPDDFILTTDKMIFDELKERKINVVLQSYQSRDDGSLSVFCTKTRRSYVGVETQLGHFNEQQRMLNAIAEILNKEK
jgi:hypothetical protein